MARSHKGQILDRSSASGGIASAALVALVVFHLAINILHGRAHAGAHVGLPPASAVFVYVVIIAAPLVGLAILPWRAMAGALIIAVSLGAALVFGLVNHFIISGADRVDHVAAEWRMLFSTTAMLLLATEAAGTALAAWAARRMVRSAS